MKKKSFLAYIDKDEWPTDMETLQSNMHQSTTLDEELTENSGNDEVILPSLLDEFQRHFPKLAEKIEDREERSVQESSHGRKEMNPRQEVF